MDKELILSELKIEITKLMSELDKNEIRNIRSKYKIEELDCLDKEKIFQCYFAHKLRSFLKNSQFTQLLVLTEVPTYDGNDRDKCDLAILEIAPKNLEEAKEKDNYGFLESSHQYPPRYPYISKLRDVLSQYSKSPILAMEFKMPGNTQFKTTFKKDLGRLNKLPEPCLRYAIMIDHSEETDDIEKNERNFDSKIELNSDVKDSDVNNFRIALFPRDVPKFLDEIKRIVVETPHIKDAGRIARL